LNRRTVVGETPYPPPSQVILRRVLTGYLECVLSLQHLLLLMRRRRRAPRPRGHPHPRSASALADGRTPRSRGTDHCATTPQHAQARPIGHVRTTRIYDDAGRIEIPGAAAAAAIASPRTSRALQRIRLRLRLQRQAPSLFRCERA